METLSKSSKNNIVYRGGKLLFLCIESYADDAVMIVLTMKRVSAAFTSFSLRVAGVIPHQVVGMEGLGVQFWLFLLHFFYFHVAQFISKFWSWLMMVCSSCCHWDLTNYTKWLFDTSALAVALGDAVVSLCQDKWAHKCVRFPFMCWSLWMGGSAGF